MPTSRSRESCGPLAQYKTTQYNTTQYAPRPGHRSKEQGPGRDVSPAEGSRRRCAIAKLSRIA